MAAPDFFFAVNAMFRHLHDRYGMDALVTYWHTLGREYYAARWNGWRQEGARAVAEDWRTYFANEPGAQVIVAMDGDSTVDLDVQVCPAIKHLRDHAREIVPYFCDHCDHVCGAMADAAGFSFERTGGMGSCRQRFVQLGARSEKR
jgi:hypothetical protein